MTGEGLVLDEDLSQLLVRPRDQDGVEHGLVGAPLTLSSLEQPGGIGNGRSLVNALVLIAISLHQRHAQTLERSAGVALQVLLQSLAVHLLVELDDGLDSVVGQSAQDLDYGAFISADSGGSIVQLLGIELRQWGHERQDDILEFSTKLGLQVADQVLAVGGLESLGNLQALNDATTAQHLDDGLLVRAEALHRLAQRGGILDGVKGIRGVDGGGALEEEKDTKWSKLITL